MSRRLPYWMVARYGPGGRAGGKGRVGEREGDLAMRIEFSSPEVRAIDLEIASKRGDLVVETGMDSYPKLF